MRLLAGWGCHCRAPSSLDCLSGPKVPGRSPAQHAGPHLSTCQPRAVCCRRSSMPVRSHHLGSLVRGSPAAALACTCMQCRMPSHQSGSTPRHQHSAADLTGWEVPVLDGTGPASKKGSSQAAAGLGFLMRTKLPLAANGQSSSASSNAHAFGRHDGRLIAFAVLIRKRHCGRPLAAHLSVSPDAVRLQSEGHCPAMHARDACYAAPFCKFSRTGPGA